MNIAERLVETAKQMPNALAIVEPSGKQVTFAELNRDSDAIAAALVRQGVTPGTKLVLMVRYGIDFISLVFGLFKAGAVLILIDPGMGFRQMIRCLTEVEPDGFVAVSPVQAVRVVFRRHFPKARQNLTVGRRWCWGGLSLQKIRKEQSISPVLPFKPISKNDDDLAAIIFTSGSTGPAKGVAFTHLIFNTQTTEIQKRLDIQPGETDLACFPFFGLFDAAMGVTTIIPEMNPMKPATANPANIVRAANHRRITQSFGSPALWRRVADYCEQTGKRLETLKRVVIAGAPVPATLLERLKKLLPSDGDIFTPYGATEALPVAVISATEVLRETKAKTDQGAGICVGSRFPTIRWAVIAITDAPLKRFEDATVLPSGQVGELAVSGPQVTPRYVTNPEANEKAKMIDASGTIWHRMGDVGYLDAEDRFWFCGRKSHRVETKSGTMFTIPCEAVFNRHPKVFRSALAQVAGEPVIFIEPLPEHFPKTQAEIELFQEELLERGQANDITQAIQTVRFKKRFPVDVRHNAKINRELLK